MSAVSVESAKNIAMIVAIVFVVLSVVSAIIVKKIVTKIILVVLMAGLALGAWTQRKSLEDCVTKAQQELESGSAGAGSITCTFFGTDVEVPAP